MHRPAEVGGDDKIIVLPRVASGEPFFGLLTSVPNQCPHGVGVEGNHTAGAFVLGLGPRGSPPHGDQALVDAQRSGRRVEVVPSQGQRFGSAQSVQHAEPEGNRPSGDRRSPPGTGRPAARPTH